MARLRADHGTPRRPLPCRPRLPLTSAGGVAAPGGHAPRDDGRHVHSPLAGPAHVVGERHRVRAGARRLLPHLPGMSEAQASPPASWKKRGNSQLRATLWSGRPTTGQRSEGFQGSGGRRGAARCSARRAPGCSPAASCVDAAHHRQSHSHRTAPHGFRGWTKDADAQSKQSHRVHDAQPSGRGGFATQLLQQPLPLRRPVLLLRQQRLHHRRRFRLPDRAQRDGVLLARF